MKKSTKLFKLFLCLMAFFVFAPNAWGRYCGYVRIIAYPAEYGEVALAPDMSSAVDNTLYWSSDTTSNRLDGKKSISIQLRAKAKEGYEFLGLYHTLDPNEDFFSKNANGRYNASSKNALTNCTYYSGSSSADAPAEADTTIIYARFGIPEPRHHYAQIQYIEDNDKKGAFLAPSDEYKYELPAKNLDSLDIRTSVDIPYNLIVCKASRGYSFTSWTVTGNHYFPFEPFNEEKEYAYLTVTSSSNDAENPEVVTVQAEYAELTPLSLTVQKLVNRGSIVVSYTNYLENASGDGIEWKSADFDAFPAENTEKSYSVYSTDEITMTATPETGYTFLGWFSVNTSTGERTFVSAEPSYTIQINEDKTYYAYFNQEVTEADKFKVGYSICQTFDQALAAITETSKTIVQINNCTIPAGNYTIPEGVTLLIPYFDGQSSSNGLQRVGSTSVPNQAYRTLTLAEGVHINVYGTIEVSGCQTAGTVNAGGQVAPGRTGGDAYGLLVMNEGSKITLNNGAQLNAWGYVQGQGEIDARRGAVVREQFEMRDWKNIINSKKFWDNGRDAIYKVLPINQYHIQNVEVRTTYHPGARLKAMASVNIDYLTLTGIVAMNDVGIIGIKYQPGFGVSDQAIFLMDNEDDSDDTWVCKYYDPATDQQVYEVNNSAYLGSLVISMDLSSFGTLGAMVGTVTMNSTDYVLPITNNFKIHLLNGNLYATQNTSLLPGAEIEINKKATLTVNANQTLYLYDTNEWGTYVSGTWNGGDNYVFGYGTRTTYRHGGVPAVRDISTQSGLGNAKLTVHGSVDVKGYLKTTDSGASITSTKDDAGTIIFTKAAPAVAYTHSDTVYQVTSITPTFVGQHCVSAKLKNDVGSSMGTFSQTAGTAAGKSFCFVDIDGDGACEWVSLTEDDCFVYDQSGVYYIKPQAYVPISSGKPEEESDHTYRDHYAGTNKIYIEAQCQWWEVEETTTPGVFHCTHPQNDTYYYYVDEAGAWVEKKFNVTFKNWDGTTLTFKDKFNQTQDHYELTYGTTPDWLGNNPTHPESQAYTYEFIGWLPTPAPVTSDVAYVAQYKESDRMYAITFNDASNEIIELVYCKLGTTPICSRYSLAANEEWTPAIGLVSENTTYTLHVNETPKTEFTVTYKDWNGTVLKTESGIESGSATPSCDEPSRAADALYSYTFKEWSPAVAATVTADAVYTATYNRASKSFTVRFFKEGTTNATKEVEGNLLSTQSVAYGVVPTPPTYSKATANHTVYTLVWSPLVAAATGDQDYIATFTEAPEQFTVTWKNGTETLAVDHVNYGVTPAYSGLTPTKEDETKIYTFIGWSPAIAAVTADQVYTAQFDEGHIKSVTVGTSESYTTAGHVETLILKASESASGQITANVTATNAYFDLTINATTTLATGATRQWHAFGVPWQVNLDTDPIQEVGGSGRTFVLGRDYDIIYYNGAKRAASGAGYWCWEFLENHLHLLQPGQGYMIAFAPSIGEVGTIRFAKKNLAPVIFNGTMTVDANTGTVANNSGWNAIANPKACKVTLNAGPTTGYVYNPATDNYSAFNIENRDYIVGKVVYIQANATQSVVINDATGNPFVAAAPARRTEVADKEYLSLDDYYQVAIASTTTEGGHVYVLPEEGKENKYVIGHDLAQFGMSAAIPQVWVNRYDTKLALNTTALINETAEFPMGVYAPTAGEYTISLNAQPSDEYNVYLTRDGQAIWNLSDGAFTADLKAGIQSNYGLRLTVNKAPQVVTGIDEAIVDANGETRKVMINNQVYIIRGEQVYSIDGQIVK